jgi:hypothetical protein
MSLALCQAAEHRRGMQLDFCVCFNTAQEPAGYCMYLELSRLSQTRQVRIASGLLFRLYYTIVSTRACQLSMQLLDSMGAHSCSN